MEHSIKTPRDTFNKKYHLTSNGILIVSIALCPFYNKINLLIFQIMIDETIIAKKLFKVFLGSNYD